MEYSFNIQEAQKYGVEEAIMLKNFKFWIHHNKANNTHQFDGRTWTYNSSKAFSIIFPFWTEKQITRILDSLQKQNIIMTGNYNKMALDRTKWYAFVDENLMLAEMFPILPNGQMGKIEENSQKKPENNDLNDFTKRGNAFAQTGGAIPDIKHTDIHSLSKADEISEKINGFLSNPMYQKVKSEKFPNLTDEQVKSELEIYYTDYPKSTNTVVYTFLSDISRKSIRVTAKPQSKTTYQPQPKPQTQRTYQTLEL